MRKSIFVALMGRRSTATGVLGVVATAPTKGSIGCPAYTNGKTHAGATGKATMAEDVATGGAGDRNSSSSRSSSCDNRRRLPAKPDETLLQIGAVPIRNLEGGSEIGDLHLQLTVLSFESEDGSLATSYTAAKDRDSLLTALKGRGWLHVAVVVVVVGVEVVAVVAVDVVSQEEEKEEE